jgi:hypothetical protein
MEAVDDTVAGRATRGCGWCGVDVYNALSSLLLRQPEMRAMPDEVIAKKSDGRLFAERPSQAGYQSLRISPSAPHEQARGPDTQYA